jgi:hypothetical protein
MKKVNKSISKEYLPIKIYIDDIEQIVAIFDENKLKYTIETEQYKYDSLSELIDSAQEKKIKSLEIKTYQPYITVEFQKMWAKLYVSSDETFTTGIFHKIDTIINKSKRLMPFIYSYYFVWIMNIVIAIEGILNKSGKLFPEYIDTTISTVWLFWLARILYIRMVTHSSIQLIKKEHVTNFFQRKRDDLILSLLSAIVGAILGVAATILTTKYLN